VCCLPWNASFGKSGIPCKRHSRIFSTARADNPRRDAAIYFVLLCVSEELGVLLMPEDVPLAAPLGCSLAPEDEELEGLVDVP
jgi:hypothetical protein